MKELIINTELIAYVDDEDFDRLNQFNWLVSQTETSTIVRRWVKGEARHVSLANETLQIYGVLIDHKDRNPFNNQKFNLRLASHSQNMMNRKKFKRSTSKYKGVSWKKSYKKWIAQARLHGKVIYLGAFDDELEAAKAYNKFASEYYGEFALLNNI